MSVPQSKIHINTVQLIKSGSQNFLADRGHLQECEETKRGPFLLASHVTLNGLNVHVLAKNYRLSRRRTSDSQGRPISHDIAAVSRAAQPVMEVETSDQHSPVAPTGRRLTLRIPEAW